MFNEYVAFGKELLHEVFDKKYDNGIKFLLYMIMNGFANNNN